MHMNLLPLSIGIYFDNPSCNLAMEDMVRELDTACTSVLAAFLMLTIKAVFGFRCSGMLAARWYH
jgi:hypothetical protein